MHFQSEEAVTDSKYVALNIHTGGPLVFVVDCKVRDHYCFRFIFNITFNSNSN